MKEFKINGISIGDGHPCYVIAEAGVNHMGDINMAFRLVDLAREAGANAVKFQLYQTHRYISKVHDRAQFDKMAKKELSFYRMSRVADYAKEAGITFLCSAHDPESLEYLVKVIKVPAIKVGSGEVGNAQYLRQVSGYNKPVILSTGMHTRLNILSAKRILDGSLWKEPSQKIALLHCNTAYPPLPSQVNLAKINKYKVIYNIPVGFSDHTVGTFAASAAVALGANIIEKHIKLYDNDYDLRVRREHKDMSISLTKYELTEMIKDIGTIECMVGESKEIPFTYFEGSWARKSIYAKYFIQKGARFTQFNTELLRPELGVPASSYHTILGQRAGCNIWTGSPITREHILKEAKE